MQKIIQQISPWFFDHGIKIIVIVFVAYLISRFMGTLIEKFVRKFVVSDRFISKEAEKKT